MKTVFWFPDSAVAGCDVEGETIGYEMSIDESDYDADPVYETKVCVLDGGEAVAADLFGFLEEDGCYSVHC